MPPVIPRRARVQSGVYSRIRSGALALTTLLLGACRSELATAPQADTPSTPAISALAAPVTALQCQATVASGAVTCGGIASALGGGLSNLTVGGQGNYLQLTSSNVSYTPGTSIFQFDVTVRNLMGQPLGTTDGSTADPNGIRVFLASAPTVTAGTGSITAANADGTGTFTAPNQSYWQYAGNLAPNTTSASKTWQLTMPATVTTFTFTVFVQAAIPNETGFLRWTPQTSNTTNQLYAFACRSTTVCVAVGSNGTIRTTANGGTLWTTRSSPMAGYLLGVACPSATVCMAVGGGGTIVTSTDGGTTWATATSGGDQLWGVSCPSATACVAVGEGGKIVTTANGGTSWTARTSGTGNGLMDVSCPSATACVAVGGDGTILTSADGGTSWTTQNSGTTSGFNGVSCASTSFCVAVAYDATILTSTNGGTLWIQQTNDTPFELWRVSCKSTTVCVAVGGTGTILTTANGGTSWIPQTSGTTETLIGVSCPLVTICVMGGNNGTIIRGSR
jgi:photosystem II stability/assembly factor-like uncharacterized protein